MDWVGSKCRDIKWFGISLTKKEPLTSHWNKYNKNYKNKLIVLDFKKCGNFVTIIKINSIIRSSLLLVVIFYNLIIMELLVYLMLYLNFSINILFKNNNKFNLKLMNCRPNNFRHKQFMFSLNNSKMIISLLIKLSSLNKLLLKVTFIARINSLFKMIFLSLNNPKWI